MSSLVNVVETIRNTNEIINKTDETTIEINDIIDTDDSVSPVLYST